MAARDRRSKSVLASASVIRWTGRRLWRSLFLVISVASLVLTVAALTSWPVFTRLSGVVASAWPGAPLVLTRIEDDMAVERDRRGQAEADAAALTARLAASEAELAATRLALTEAETTLAQAREARIAAEALARRRLEQLAAATRRWLDLERDIERLERLEAAEPPAQAP